MEVLLASLFVLIVVVPIWILVKLHEVSRQQKDSFDKLSILSGKVQQLLDGQKEVDDRPVAGEGEPAEKEESPPQPEPEPVVEAQAISAPEPPSMPPAEAAEPIAARTAATP